MINKEMQNAEKLSQIKNFRKFYIPEKPKKFTLTKPLTICCNVQNTSLLYTHDANKNVTEVLYLATQNGLAAHYEYSPFGELRDFSHLSTNLETSNSEVNAIAETLNSEINAITETSNYGHLASSQSLSPETNAIDYAYNSRSANPSPGDLIGWRDTRITEIDIRTFNPFRFSSEYHDDELSLIYYNYRHYNPATGRFFSRDPIEEQGGTNLYNFTANNPINFIDLLGENNNNATKCDCRSGWEKVGVFRITVYNVANEKDYVPIKKGDKLYAPNGLDRKFSWKFMNDVDMQGTGISVDNKYIKLESTYKELKNKKFKYAYVSKITGASGRELTHGTSVAVDPSVIKLGSKVCVKGYGEKSADDTGGKIKGKHLDFFLNITRKEAILFGVKSNIDVYVKKGKGKK